MPKSGVYGLTSILIGDLAADGGPGTTLTEVIGWTVIDSAALTSTEPTTEDINIEESDAAIYNLTSTPGTYSLAFATFNNDATVLKLLYGGTVTTDVNGVSTWAAPREGTLHVEKTVQVTTKNGSTLLFPRMKLTATLDMAFAKARLGQTNIVGAVLLPNKAGVAPISATIKAL